MIPQLEAVKMILPFLVVIALIAGGVAFGVWVMHGKLKAAELERSQATAMVAELKTTLEGFVKSQEAFQHEMLERAKRTEAISRKAGKDVQLLQKAPDDGCLDKPLPPDVKRLLQPNAQEGASNSRGLAGPSATTGLP